jgi:carbon-monoxide dehydrogenase large subunit
VVDALKEFNVDHLDMPLTPVKIWQALQGKATQQNTE